MSKRKSRLTGWRQAWYIRYRQLRIVRRETAKAQMDLIIYGSCFIMHTNIPDFIQHIPFQDITITTRALP